MRRMGRAALAVLSCVVVAGCVSYDPYAAYTPEERAKLQANDAIKLQQWQDEVSQRHAQQLDRETLNNEHLAHRIAWGNTSPVHGVRVRGKDDFEGSLNFERDPYDNRLRTVYGKGVYRSTIGAGMGPTPPNGQYSGDFKYFVDSPREGRLRTGTYVLIGEFMRHDGVRNVGIYVAENVMADQPLHFIPATRPYLDALASRYAGQVQAFRKEEERRLQAERASNGGLFGSLLALGLGGLMLSSADIPGADVAQIGAALFKHVMTDGQSQALASIARSGRGAYGMGPQRTAAGASSARAVLAGMGMGQGGRPAGVPGAGSGSSSQTTQYSFSCPAGHSSTIPITYKSASCLSAKQEMARAYACNMVDQFSRVASRCSQACGSPQCEE